MYVMITMSQLIYTVSDTMGQAQNVMITELVIYIYIYIVTDIIRSCKTKMFHGSRSFIKVPYKFLKFKIS